MKQQRVNGLDVFRGLAISLMIVYHFIYDLNYFHIIDIDIKYSTGFILTRYIIISMFLLSVGMSLTLAHKGTIKWISLSKRIFQLILASSLVSISTYIIFPNSWVYFGILHLIVLASFLTLPLLKFPKITLLLTLLILLGSITKTLHLHALYTKLKVPLSLPLHSEDLIPLIPWISAVYIGTLIIHYNLHQKIFDHKIFNISLPINKVLKKMGQHSLIIYLLHQPIFFLCFELFIKFSSK